MISANRARPLVTWSIALLAVTLVMLSVRSYLDKAHVALVFLLVVLGASSAGGRAIGLSVAGLAFLAFNYFFLPPYLTLIIANPLDWLVLLSFLITSAVAAQLLYRGNATALQMTQRAAEIDRLASLGAETLNAAKPEDALVAIATVIRTSLGVDSCEIFQRQSGDRIQRVAWSSASAGDATGEVATVDAGSLLDWMAQQQQSTVELIDGTVHIVPELSPEKRHVSASRAGASRSAAASLATADDRPAVRALTTILRVRGETVGMLRVASDSGVVLSTSQGHLLDALTYYAALGVERLRLVADTQRLEAERRMEIMHSALLTAVSHDLRTPLTTIKGIAHEIAGGADPSRAEIIGREADRLNSMIGDLLDLSRIQAGAVRPVLAINTADELVGQALQQARGVLRERKTKVEFDTVEILSGVFDLTQSIRILVNLLENAVKYSSSDEPINISVGRDGEHLRIAVKDRGIGVAPDEQLRIFEPFYRPLHVTPDVGGTGLGLSIARGLADAQAGGLEYSPRDGGGSVFTLVLPIAELTPPESTIE